MRLEEHLPVPKAYEGSFCDGRDWVGNRELSQDGRCGLGKEIDLIRALISPPSSHATFLRMLDMIYSLATLSNPFIYR